MLPVLAVEEGRGCARMPTMDGDGNELVGVKLPGRGNEHGRATEVHRLRGTPRRRSPRRAPRRRSPRRAPRLGIPRWTRRRGSLWPSAALLSRSDAAVPMAGCPCSGSEQLGRCVARGKEGEDGRRWWSDPAAASAEAGGRRALSLDRQRSADGGVGVGVGGECGLGFLTLDRWKDRDGWVDGCLLGGISLKWPSLSLFLTFCGGFCVITVCEIFDGGGFGPEGGRQGRENFGQKVGVV